MSCLVGKYLVTTLYKDLLIKEFENDPLERGKGLDYYEKATTAKENSEIAMFWLGVFLEHTDKEKAREWLKKSAALGFPPAMGRLSNLLEPTNKEANRHGLEQLAKAGDPHSMVKLAVLLEERDRDGNPTKKKKALEWYSQALQKIRDPNTMLNMRYLHKQDLEGIPADQEKALYWLKEAAKAGSIDAMCVLGDFLEYTDREKALYWLKEAAKTDSTTAMYMLGNLLAHTNREQAIHWFKEAADRDNELAMFRLAVLLEERDRDDKPTKKKEALKWYNEILRKDNSNKGVFMFNMGRLYAQDLEGIPANKALARVYFKKEAEAGCVYSMVRLGNLLIEEGNTDIQKKEGLGWLIKAAQAGNKVAQFNVGIFYLKSVLQDPRANAKENAINNLLKASEKGLTTAMIELAKIYMGYYGNDSLDLDKALFWLTKADALGDTNAQKYLMLAQKPNDIEEGEIENLLKSTEVPEHIPLEEENSREVEPEKVCQESEHKEESGESPAASEAGPMQEEPLKPSNLASAQKTPMKEEAELPRSRKQKKAQQLLDDEKSPADLASAQERPGKVQEKHPKARAQKFDIKGTLRGINSKQMEMLQAVVASPKPPLRPDSREVVEKIMEGRADITAKDIEALFDDPYFSKQVHIAPTKSGLKVGYRNIATNKLLQASTHAKHARDRKRGKFKGEFDPGFLGDLKPILEAFNLP